MSAPPPLPSEVGEGVQLQEKPQQMPSGGESHSLCERCHSSLPSTVYRVSEGVQCNMDKDAEQKESGNQDEDEDEEEINSEEHSVSPTWEGQFNEVDEGIQYGVSWFESQLETYPHQMPSRGKETLPDSKTKRSWKKPVVNRKLSTDERS